MGVEDWAGGLEGELVPDVVEGGRQEAVKEKAEAVAVLVEGAVLAEAVAAAEAVGLVDWEAVAAVATAVEMVALLVMAALEGGG